MSSNVPRIVFKFSLKCPQIKQRIFLNLVGNPAQNMKLSIKDFFSKYDQKCP